MEPNRKLSPDHLPPILHGALVGAGSLMATYWLGLMRNLWLHSSQVMLHLLAMDYPNNGSVGEWVTHQTRYMS
jgi:hypothetical protein